MLCAACSSKQEPAATQAPEQHHHHAGGAMPMSMPMPMPSGAAAPVAGDVQLSPQVMDDIGVRTAAVEYGPMPGGVTAPGVVRYDERSLRNLYAPTETWLRKLSVRAVGELVAAGQPLFELESTQLLTVDREYLRAHGGLDWDNPYVRGLRSFGLSDDLIVALSDNKRAPGRIPYRAAFAGVVTELSYRQDAHVPQGASVMQIASLDPIWVIAEVPEAQSGAVQTDATAQVFAPAYPGRPFSGKVDYIYPELNEGNRTVRVRVVVPNPERLLKQNMYVTAQLEDAAQGPVTNVPREAVIRGGRSDHVVVALGDGRFRAREVKTGMERKGRVAILEGLTAGEQVVTSAVFLLDSETSLRSGLERLDSAPGQTHDHHHMSAVTAR
jgi:Cu(I)/Ag(I) efflux system membrane fusion protein